MTSRKSGSIRKDCPHCGTHFERGLDGGFGEFQVHRGREPRHFLRPLPLGTDSDAEDAYATLLCLQCPRCSELTFEVHVGTLDSDTPWGIPEGGPVYVAYPQGVERAVSPHVPVEIAADYSDATRVAELSPKASSTEARRCLQATVRAVYTDIPRRLDLFDEIKWVVEQDTSLPEELTGALHALRKAGNFGAHPAEDGLTPAFELDPVHLEACLHVLEWFFEEKFDKPATRAARFATLRAAVFPPKDNSR
jgi:hypothetical protein